MDDPQKKAIVSANIDKMVRGGASEDEIEAYIQSEGIAPVDPNASLHADYRSGNLAKRMRRANKAEAANVAEGLPIPGAETTDPDYKTRLGMMLERGASAIGPGGRLLPTAASYVAKKLAGDPTTWDETATENASNINTAGRELVKNKMGVHVPLLGDVTLADLPASAFAFKKYLDVLPAAATKMLGAVPTTGAVMAGGARLTAPGTGESVPRRLASTAVHAAIGAAVPKVLGGVAQVPRMAGAWARSRAVPALDENVVARAGEMENIAGPLYQMFTDIGELPRTPQLSAILDLPLVRSTINRIRAEDPTVTNLPDAHAVILDRVYKRIGNKAYNATNDIEPTAAREVLKDAIEGAAQRMGESYATPLAIWRRGNQGIDAAELGSKVMGNAANGKTPSTKLLTESPAAFRRDYAQGSTKLGTERTAATEGILSNLATQPKFTWRGPTPALRAAPDLLNFAEAGKRSALGDLVAALSGRDASPRTATIASDLPRNIPIHGTSGGPPQSQPQPLAGILRNPEPGIPMKGSWDEPLGLPPSPSPKLLPSTTTPTLDALESTYGRPMPSGALRMLTETTTPTMDALLKPKALLGPGEAGPMLQRIGYPGAVRGVANPISTYEQVIDAIRKMMATP